MLSDYILHWMQNHGIKTLIQSGNVIGYIPGKNKAKCLILSGHMDTIGAGDEDQWENDPFKPTIKDGKIYGLGASDMKAGVAVLMRLASHYAKKKPPCDLWFPFVCREELDGSGTISFLEWFNEQPQNKCYEEIEALIAEPTGSSYIEVGHRGNQFVKIAINSESGHASQPQLVKDPVIKIAARIIDGFQDLERELANKYSHKQLGKPTLSLTAIKAGDLNIPNKIASKAVLQLDIRTTPSLHGKIYDILRYYLSGKTDKAQIVEFEGSPSGWTEESSSLRQIFKATYPEMMQGVMSGSSDLCFFTQSGIPCVIFGPGEKSSIHCSDEFADLESLDESLKILKSLVGHYGSF